MKFFAALLFAAGVSAASSATSPDTPGSTCLADYILEDCLKSTTTTANNCKPTDYVCLCAAYQAVLTCYNNCPNDIRAPSVQQQVDSYCRTASLLATTPSSAPKTKTAGSSNSEETASAPSNDDSSPTAAGGSSQTTGSSSTGTKTAGAAKTSSSNAAATMAGHVAGIFMAVAGAAVAMV